ncbi:hypothetical protein Mapa_011059 [Marchantia paleacea]|nr:hypothetical protein Mapa_011059 [Marchantia paleacea]
MAQSTECLDVFILSGQSNMAGRGGVHILENGTRAWNKVVPMSANVSDGSILRLTAQLNWEPAKEPLHQDIDVGKVCGVGPGLVFGAKVLKHLRERGQANPTIGLVPCAIGGTSIQDWEKGGILYNTMLHRVDVARRGGGTLRALLWYQGESDAESKKHADLYKWRLEKFFSDFRSDLNDNLLPIIQVKICGTWPFVEEVRAAQATVQVPRVYTVDAWGLELNPDHMHLTTESQEKLGLVMAEKYLSHCHA